MKVLIATMTALSTISLMANVCTWTGGARDGKWSSPGNWSALPAATDEVEFDPGDGALDVTLDSAGLTTVSIVRVKSGKVTLSAAEGSSLRTTGTTSSGLDVAADAELAMAAPLDLNARFNKSGAGTVRFQSTLTSGESGVTSYFWDGKVFIEGNANLSFDGTLGLGLGKGARALIVLKDNARLRVGNTLATGYNDNKSASADLIVDGDGATLTTWKLYLGNNTAQVDPDVVHNMVVSNGTVSITQFRVGDTSSASYVQEGGTVSVSALTIKDDPTLSASFVLKGGKFDYNNAEAVLARYEYANFSLQGGTFAATKGLTVNTALALPGTVAFEVPDKQTVVFEESPVLSCDSVLTKKGAGKLLVKKDLLARGALSVAAGEVCFGADVTVSNPKGDYTPYPISVAEGATLRLDAVTTRFSLPLDLALNGTVAMSEGENGYTCRSVLVWHKAIGKGRLAPSAANHLTGGNGSSIVVPWVWTGAAGDNAWSNKDNWDNGIVPESRSSTIVDISAATAPIVLSSAINLGGIVSMPGDGQVRTITGEGSIQMVVSSSYQCCGYVQEGSELVIDVGFSKEKANYLTVLGGGKLTAKKGYPTLNGNVPPFSLDATVALAGSFGSTSDMYLGALSHCKEGRGLVTFEDGADVKFKDLLVTADVSGEFPVKSFRQSAGTVTGDQIYITLFASQEIAPDPFAYILDGGTMSMFAVKLGAQYTTAYKNIIPGGSFVMNGGTATINSFMSYQNQNYFRLNGGDLYCKTFDVATLSDSIVGTGRIDPNAVSYELGAVTLHPKDSGGLTISADTTLTGVGGDTRISCDNGNAVTFAAGCRLDGQAGLVKSGTGTLNLNGSNTFTGMLTVSEGSVVFGAASTIDGIAGFAVTDPSAAITVSSAATATLGRIDLASDSSLSLVAGSTLTVRRLRVGGEDYAEGEHTFGDGKVVVSKAGAVLWIGSNGGSWSDGGNWATGTPPDAGASVDFGDVVLPDSYSIVVDQAVSLSSFAYARPGVAGQLTLSGTATLTLADGGTICVDEGDELVVSTPLVLGGVLRKTGGGRLVLSGGLSCADAGILYAEAGETEIACAVNGVKVKVSGLEATPAVTIGGGTVLSDTLVVLDESLCRRSAIVELGEGTITCSFSGMIVGPSIDLSLTGTAAFAQSNDGVRTEIASTVGGKGTIVQKGPGSLTLNGPIGSAGLSLADGSLTIGAKAASSMDGTGVFSVAKVSDARLELDFAGCAPVRTLDVRGHGKRDGFYDERLDLVSGALDPSKGYLHVLTDSRSGLSIVIR